MKLSKLKQCYEFALEDMLRAITEIAHEQECSGEFTERDFDSALDSTIEGFNRCIKRSEVLFEESKSMNLAPGWEVVDTDNLQNYSPVIQAMLEIAKKEAQDE